MLKNFRSTFRSSNWWHYKLPPLFGISYLFILFQKIPFFEATILLVALFVWMLGAAGFGYYLNDVFDTHADELAGKKNIAAEHTSSEKLNIILALFLISLIPWVFLKNQNAFLLAGFHLFLFCLYSISPARLKERGVLGVIADALYAHAVPAAVVISAVLVQKKIPNSAYVWITVILVWQFLTGFRNIIIHQVEDFRNDKKANAGTWVAEIGIVQARKIAVVIFPAEVILFFALIFFVFTISIAAGILILALMLFRFWRYGMFQSKYFKKWRNKMFFFNNIYEEDFPLALLTVGVFENQQFGWLLAAHLILFPRFWLNLFYHFRERFAKK